MDYSKGEFMEVLKAVEKQVPKDVPQGGLFNAFAFCPSCDKELAVTLFKKWTYEYCPHCGQRLNWK